MFQLEALTTPGNLIPFIEKYFHFFLFPREKLIQYFTFSMKGANQVLSCCTVAACGDIPG